MLWPRTGVSRSRSSSSHLSKDGGVEEGLEKEGQEFDSIVSELFHMGGEYWGDLVGQEAGESSCREGLVVSGRVTN